MVWLRGKKKRIKTSISFFENSPISLLLYQRGKNTSVRKDLQFLVLPNSRAFRSPTVRNSHSYPKAGSTPPFDVHFRGKKRGRFIHGWFR